jgi:hypothetical protein
MGYILVWRKATFLNDADQPTFIPAVLYLFMPRKSIPPGMTWKIVLTLLIMAVFLIGSLVYVGFYANGYSLFQKIVVFLIALIAAGVIISIMWVVWAGSKGLIREPR